MASKRGVCERASCCHVYGILLAIHAEQCMPVHLSLKSEQGVCSVYLILSCENFVVYKSGKPNLKKLMCEECILVIFKALLSNIVGRFNYKSQCYVCKIPCISATRK